MKNTTDDKLRNEYDLTKMSGIVRGKYSSVKNSHECTITLENDVAVVFPDSESVNNALRMIIRAAKEVNLNLAVK